MGAGQGRGASDEPGQPLAADRLDASSTTSPRASASWRCCCTPTCPSRAAGCSTRSPRATASSTPSARAAAARRSSGSRRCSRSSTRASFPRSMRYVMRTFVGMVLFAFCWVVVGYGIYQMLQIGTCASGGPYVSARQCPDGTGGLILALIGGDPRLLRRRRAIYLTRGTPPGVRARPRRRADRSSGSGPGSSGASPPAASSASGARRPNPGPGGDARRADRRLHGADHRGRRPAVGRLRAQRDRTLDNAGAGPVCQRRGAPDRARRACRARWRAPRRLDGCARAGTLTDETEFETLQAQDRAGGTEWRAEGALNPIPIIVHVLAIAAGLFVGWMVMDRITPDFPTADTEPGVESSAAPRTRCRRRPRLAVSGRATSRGARPRSTTSSRPARG